MNVWVNDSVIVYNYPTASQIKNDMFVLSTEYLDLGLVDFGDISIQRVR